MIKRKQAEDGSIGSLGSVAVAATYAAAVLLSSRPAIADEICGSPQEKQYVEAMAAGMQKFAPKVTRTGTFSVKDEYPGGTSVAVITFVDRGSVVFVHRVNGSNGASATTVRPGKTKSGDPGLSVALTQGSLGDCVYSVVPRDGRFVVAFRGLKR